MRKRITKRSVDSLKPGSRAHFLWDTNTTGFGCKVTPSGRKVYILQYRPSDRNWKTAPKRITIGKHGDLTADEARKIAETLLVEVKSGSDPSLDRRPGASPNVSDLAERFIHEYLPTKRRPPRQSTIDHYELLFRCHIVPRLGSKRVDAVTTFDIERLHANMRSMSAFFAWFCKVATRLISQYLLLSTELTPLGLG